VLVAGLVIAATTVVITITVCEPGPDIPDVDSVAVDVSVIVDLGGSCCCGAVVVVVIIIGIPRVVVGSGGSGVGVGTSVGTGTGADVFDFTLVAVVVVVVVAAASVVPPIGTTVKRVVNDGTLIFPSHKSAHISLPHGASAMQYIPPRCSPRRSAAGHTRP
jgi:hypothetical protein